jgi:hypothetical protein
VPVERRQKQAKSAREQQDFKQLRCDGFRVACHDSRWANVSDQWLAALGLPIMLDAARESIASVGSLQL